MKKRKAPFAWIGTIVALLAVGAGAFWVRSASQRDEARVAASKELLAWVDETLGGIEISACRPAKVEDDRDGTLHRNGDVVLSSRAGKPFVVSRLLNDPAVTGSSYWKKFEERLERLETASSYLDHRSCEIWNRAIRAYSSERKIGSQDPVPPISIQPESN